MTDRTPRGDAPQAHPNDAEHIGALAPAGETPVPAGWVRLTNKHGVSYYNPTTSDMVFNESGKTTIGLAYGSFNESPDEVMRLIAAAQSPPAAAPALTEEEWAEIALLRALVRKGARWSMLRIELIESAIDRLLGNGGAA